MDYCLPDTRNQDECPRTAELLTQENQAENKQKSIELFFQHKLSKTHLPRIVGLLTTEETDCQRRLLRRRGRLPGTEFTAKSVGVTGLLRLRTGGVSNLFALQQHAQSPTHRRSTPANTAWRGWVNYPKAETTGEESMRGLPWMQAFSSTSVCSSSTQ